MLVGGRAGAQADTQGADLREDLRVGLGQGGVAGFVEPSQQVFELGFGRFWHGLIFFLTLRRRASSHRKCWRVLFAEASTHHSGPCGGFVHGENLIPRSVRERGERDIVSLTPLPKREGW